MSHRPAPSRKALVGCHRRVLTRALIYVYRFKRDGLTRKHKNLIKKLRKSKAAVEGMEKPETVRTHLRNMPIIPEMVGSVVGVYNGKVFNTVEIKPEMIGSYLGEYAITYRPVSHGRAGLAAGSKFIPLK